MRDPNQKMRFTDNELSMIKGLFADNEDLLFLIRKVLLQFPLSEHEEITLKKTMNDWTFDLLKKFFLPDLDPDAPLFQLTDMYIGLQGDLKSGVEASWAPIRAKELEIKYIAQQLEALKDITEAKAPSIVLKDLVKVKTRPSKEDVWVNITARNYILSFVDTNLQQIKYLAGRKEETVEETKDRLMKDSAK